MKSNIKMTLELILFAIKGQSKAEKKSQENKVFLFNLCLVTHYLGEKARNEEK